MPYCMLSTASGAILRTSFRSFANAARRSSGSSSRYCDTVVARDFMPTLSGLLPFVLDQEQLGVGLGLEFLGARFAAQVVTDPQGGVREFEAAEAGPQD